MKIPSNVLPGSEAARELGWATQHDPKPPEVCNFWVRHPSTAALKRQLPRDPEQHLVAEWPRKCMEMPRKRKTLDWDWFGASLILRYLQIMLILFLLPSWHQDAQGIFCVILCCFHQRPSIHPSASPAFSGFRATMPRSARSPRASGCHYRCVSQDHIESPHIQWKQVNIWSLGDHCPNSKSMSETTNRDTTVCC